CHGRAMLPSPAGNLDQRRVRPRRDRFVGEPMLDVFREGLCRREPILRPKCQRLLADRLELRGNSRVEGARWADRTLVHFFETGIDGLSRLARTRRPASEEMLQRCTQAIEIGCRAQLVELAQPPETHRRLDKPRVIFGPSSI